MEFASGQPCEPLMNNPEGGTAHFSDTPSEFFV